MADFRSDIEVNVLGQAALTDDEAFKKAAHYVLSASAQSPSDFSIALERFERHCKAHDAE